MIQWYDNNPVVGYPHEAAWEAGRNDHINTLLRMFDEN